MDNEHAKKWEDRRIDWEQAYWTPDHPHRKLIVDKVVEMNPKSVLEVGCAVGVNLYLIKKALPDVIIAGCDINEQAVIKAREKLPGADIRVARAESLPYQRGAFDLILTDACLIYINPDRMYRVMKDFRRIANRFLFNEFHTEDDYKRALMLRTDNYFAYNYNKVLMKAKLTKIPEDAWPGEPWKSTGYLIEGK